MSMGRSYLIFVVDYKVTNLYCKGQEKSRWSFLGVYAKVKGVNLRPKNITSIWNYRKIQPKTRCV